MTKPTLTSLKTKNFRSDFYAYFGTNYIDVDLWIDTKLESQSFSYHDTVKIMHVLNWVIYHD